jgi:hypothetical protein
MKLSLTKGVLEIGDLQPHQGDVAAIVMEL